MEPCGIQSSPIARHVLCRNAHALPGCSLTEPQQKPISISHDMMQAYVMMRGPSQRGSEDEDDPLFEWIRLREDLEGGKKRLDDRSDIAHMLSHIDQALQSENPGGDSPRAAVFELRRPSVSHIQPPDGMDLSMHVLNACCADFEFETDEDDEDIYVPRGRISPCTFLAWSRDCNPWDVDKLKAPADENATRQRPPSPELCDTPPNHPRPERWPAWGVDQLDQECGYMLSPHYPTPSSPSIVWTAEGIDADRMNHPAFEETYSRMDPIAAMSFRKLKQYGRPNSETSDNPFGNDEYYTHSEIESVVAQDIHGLADGFEITHVQNHIGAQYAKIATAEAEVKCLEYDLHEQTCKIRSLQFQKEQVLSAVRNLQNKRLEEAQQDRAQSRDVRRRRRIQRHFRNHVSDVEYKHEQSKTKLEKDRVRKERNDATIQGLENDILRACMEVGKQNLDEVYDELSEGPNPYLLRDPAADSGREGGGGLMASLELDKRNFSEFTDILAKPSPLRIVKDRSSKGHSLGNGVEQPAMQHVNSTIKGKEKQETPVSLYSPVDAADYIDDFAVQPPPSLADQGIPGPSESELARIYAPSYMEAKAIELGYF